jgi:L-histidine Nalpha-methyltransferase
MSKKSGMPDTATVTIHKSQFPEQVLRDLGDSLRCRRVNHKFHYETVKQAQKWLRLHQAYSPSRTDPDCFGAYEGSFQRAVTMAAPGRTQLIGLGCGGGQKDTRLLKLLSEQGREVFYVPVDVSTPLVLVARSAALSVVPVENCSPLVCDLAEVEELGALLDTFAVAGASRLITFFGMIPNFRPQMILPRLASVVQGSDLLLFSANLAPGLDYAAGVQRILPLYDNEMTKEWLVTFLLDLGVNREDGLVRIGIGELPGESGLKRVEAWFEFQKCTRFQIDDEEFAFESGEKVLLFFSYRHTVATIQTLLAAQGLRVLANWVAASGEEGVFLVARDR